MMKLKNQKYFKTIWQPTVILQTKAYWKDVTPLFKVKETAVWDLKFQCISALKTRYTDCFKFTRKKYPKIRREI